MEELKLILATFAQLGETGKEAFIWWLLIDKIAVGLLWLVAACILAYIITRFIVAITTPGGLSRYAMLWESVVRGR